MVKSHSFLLNLQNSWPVFFKVAFIIVLITFLIGCPMQVSKQLDFDDKQTAHYYLSKMESSTGDDRINWQLLAIRSLIIENNLIQAEKLIYQLPANLSKEQQKEKHLTQGELAIKNNTQFELNQIFFAELSDNQRIRYYKIKLGLDGQKQDINAQIRDYIELEKYGTENHRQNTINETWNFLTSLSDETIQRIWVYANEPILQGWIDLAYTYRNNANVYIVEESDDLETVLKKEDDQFNLLKNAVSEWQMQYSTHPAARYLPRNIYGEKYRLPDNISNQNVALFLPLSGSSGVFGEVIYLGYSDATKFYAQDPQQNIYLYDTNSYPLDVLVTQAKQQGVELIVGPLLKQDVLTIMQLSPSIPILALNKIDDNDLPFNLSSKICFFALSPEDEAEDAAQHIYSQNKRRPLLIIPQNDLGNRVVNSFIEQWNQNDSALNEVYVQYFESEKTLSSQMNSGIGIELEGQLITNPNINKVEIEQDQLGGLLNSIISNDEIIDDALMEQQPQFDAIYIYASHEELTLIKSMLEMKSNKVELDKKGQEIAVNKIIPAIYSSSRSNTANTTQDFRYDMDRIQFSDIPLLINQTKLIAELPGYIKNDYSLVRLYAMGIDARQLANRFNQLEPYQIDILDGMTGKLSVGKECKVTRSLVWQQYRNGKEVMIK